MRLDPLGRRRTLGRANEVMGIAGIDVFANLFMVVMLLVGSSAAELRLKPGQIPPPDQASIEVVVTPTGIFVADSGPIAVEELAERVAAFDREPTIRLRVERSVPIEREHSVLAALMSAGASTINLDLSMGARP